MKSKGKHRTAVIICARMWLDCDQKIRDWIKNHPNEKILDRIHIVFTEGNGGRYCGGLMVETEEESLPSDF